MTSATIENVSDTALWVAAHRAAESARSDALFHDPFAVRLAGERGRALARSVPYGAITGWILAIRTVAIDRFVAEAIADGVDTVVNLGAGLDSRPYRLELPPTLRWIEVDFPALLATKTAALVGETPRCRLERLGADVSDRPAAQRLYRDLGAQTAKALVITEGVVPYLTNEQAGHLAEDLRAIPSFRYWIQDYRRHFPELAPPPKLRRALAKSPFRFEHPEPLDFFARRGWKVVHDILAVPEGERLGRKFPIPFPWNLLVPLLPKAKREKVRRAQGFVLFGAA